MNKKQFFDYKDINLVPKYSTVESRSECDTSVIFGRYKFELPVVPANMESVINENLCEKLARKSHFYIMHRFSNIIPFMTKMKKENLFTSISIGVNGDSYFLLDKLMELELIPDYITIDVAHGHHIKVKDMIKHIKSKSDFKDTYIIAGNISTCRAAGDLLKWGADILKIGIGPGHACETYMETKFGSRGIQASVIYDIANFVKFQSIKRNVKIIADGGISNVGDIVASIVLGADMVMAGSLLTGYIDSPFKPIIKDGEKYYKYYGSASEQQSGKKDRFEGTTKLIPFKDYTLLESMNKIKQSIQSAISYGGGRELSSLRDVEFITL